jgi:lysophospholipase L1-like esterase
METAGAITFNNAVWFCASGKAFFFGIALLIISLFVVIYSKKKTGFLSSIIFTLLGLVLIWLSSTPLSRFWWGLWISGFGFLYIIESPANNLHNKTLWAIRFSLILLCLLPGLLECRYWFAPVISLNNTHPIYVIGDSVSSGIGGPDENTWPKILSGKLCTPVVNLAIAGATADSALKRQVPRAEEISSTVIIEIGGNDILNSTKPELFEKSMRQIFSKLETTANNVVWFELPLLPWKTEYGRIQRNLAKEFKITLIPKRILSGVFQTPGATSDSIHLTEKGHQLLGQEIYQLFKQSIQTPAG